MLRFFRLSGSKVAVVVVVIAAGLWLLIPVEQAITLSDKYNGFLFRALSGYLGSMPDMQIWCGLALFILAAAMITLANARLYPVNKFSYLPALCYVLLVSGVPEIQLFCPELVAAVLLMGAFIVLADSFSSERLSYGFFIAPAIISIASFFTAYVFISMIAVWACLILWRPAYWREWIFSLLGFIFPLYLAFCWFFLVRGDYTRLLGYFNETFALRRSMPELTIPAIVLFTCSMAVFLISLAHLKRNPVAKATIFRYRYRFLLAIAVITIGMIVALPDILPRAWYLLAFPVSIIIGSFLATVKSGRKGNIVLMLLFAAPVIIRLILFSTA